MSDKRSSIAFYRLGVRLGQALPICNSMGVDPESEFPSLHAAITRLRVAWEALVHIVGHSPMTRRGADPLNRMEGVTRSATVNDVELIISQYLNEFRDLVREYAKLRRTDSRSELAWFDLGLEIVRVEDVTAYPILPYSRMPAATKGDETQASPSTPPIPKPPKRFEWPDKVRLDLLLKSVGVSLDDVFRVHDDVEPANDIRWIYAMSPQPTAWKYLEVALDHLEPPTKVKAANKPALLRNLHFLDWYDQNNEDTYHRPTRILQKWNRENPGEKVSNSDVVKKGIVAAKKYLAAKQISVKVAITRLKLK